MNVDTLDLVVEDEGIIREPEVYAISVSFDILLRVEYSHGSVLHDLENCTRMYDHEVDGITSSGVATRSACGTGLCKSDSGVEPCLRNTDYPHVIVELDIGVHVVLGVDYSALDLFLETHVAGRGNEQDSALIGNFLIVHSGFSGIDESRNIGRSRSDVCRSAGEDIACSRELAEGISVYFQVSSMAVVSSHSSVCSAPCFHGSCDYIITLFMRGFPFRGTCLYFHYGIVDEPYSRYSQV